MARDLDAQVEAFRTRPLDAGPYTFVAADALVLEIREAGRTVNVHALLATGVSADGYREILGLHVTSAEDGAATIRAALQTGLVHSQRRRASTFSIRKRSQGSGVNVSPLPGASGLLCC